MGIGKGVEKIFVRRSASKAEQWVEGRAGGLRQKDEGAEEGGAFSIINSRHHLAIERALTIGPQ